MKRSAFILILIMFAVSLNAANGFIEKRKEWWHIRLMNMASEKIRIEKSGALDLRAAGLLEAEAVRARSVLAMLERYDNNISTQAPAESTGTESQKTVVTKEAIARHEIEGLFRHAAECADLYDSLHYGEEALTLYADHFNALLIKARSGSVSKQIEGAVAVKSLLPLMEEFDRVKLEREFATKNYLRKTARAAMASVSALVKFYKSSGVPATGTPAREKFSSLETRICALPRVPIDSWSMNEGNYIEIDKNAAVKISRILKRKSIELKTIAGAGGADTATILMSNPTLSCVMPRGWAEERVGQLESYAGVMKSFRNGDAVSTIKIVKIPLDENGMKDMADEWLQKSGLSLVEKRWGSIRGLEYLWILSKDRDRLVSETFSMSKDGYALLITGKTDHGGYRKFKVQFRQIINTLKAEGM